MERLTEKIQRFFHPAMIKILSMRRTFPIKVMGQIPENHQFIYIANHYCIDDIPTAGEVIKNHVYALVSDEDRYTLNGLALGLNGVVWTNRLDKSKRKHSKEALVRHLKLGHSVIMYPESTWNLSPNLPMLPLNYGCISISLETGIPILPIYFYFAEDICKVEINKPFYPCADKEKSIKELRDILATSAWRFYETEPALKQAELDPNYWEDNIAKRYAKYDRARKNPVEVRKYESQFIFRDKSIVTAEEAYAHLNTITPTMKNAFLFNKRNHL